MNKAVYQNHMHYIKEGWNKVPKESFKKLASLIERSHPDEESSVLDVGCAAGELINYLKTRFEKFEFTGIDVAPELIDEARKLIPFAKLVKASALDLPDDMHGSFDIVMATGVLSIFDIDEVPLFFENLIRCTKKCGKVYVFAHFNDHPVDLMITHRKRIDGKMGEWEKGWNIYNKETIEEVLDGCCRAHRFHEFKLPFQLEPKSDPVRTWTIKTEHNPFQLVNGLKLMVDLSFLEIEI